MNRNSKNLVYTPINFIGITVKAEPSDSQEIALIDNLSKFEWDGKIATDSEKLIPVQEEIKGEIESSDTFLEDDTEFSLKSHKDMIHLREEQSADECLVIKSTGNIGQNEATPVNKSSSSVVTVKKKIKKYEKKTSEKYASRVQHAVKCLSEKVEKVKETNNIDKEYDAFGVFLAASLMNLPLENALSAQLNIMTVLANEKRKAAFGRSAQDLDHRL